MPRSLSKKSSTLTHYLALLPSFSLPQSVPVSISRYPPREYHPTRRTLILPSLSLFHSFSSPSPPSSCLSPAFLLTHTQPSSRDRVRERERPLSTSTGRAPILRVPFAISAQRFPDSRPPPYFPLHSSLPLPLAVCSRWSRSPSSKLPPPQSGFAHFSKPLIGCLPRQTDNLAFRR